MQMYDGGYIRLYRSIMNWDWYSDTKTKCLFLHLLLTVNYIPDNWRGREIEVGQRVTSLAKLASELGFSIQEIRTCLKHLQATGEVTCETTSQYPVITVNNYVSFQSGTHKKHANSHTPKQATNKQLTNDQQQYKKAIKEKGNNNKGGVAPTPLGGVALPEFGQGDCCVVYDCERHYYPKEWEDEANERGWEIEQFVRWNHHNGVYV